MKKVYPIEIITHTEDILFYPSDLEELKEIDLIYFGQHSCPAKVQKNPTTEGNDYSNRKPSTCYKVY